MALDYGIIGNCETAALVSKDASIDWFCFPRFDSPSAFSRLLDPRVGGSFSLRPVGKKFWSKQEYLPDTNVLVTTFVSDEAEVSVTDFMPIFAEPYRTRPLQRICRTVKVIRGRANVEMVMEPAFDYARIKPKFEFKSGVWLARGEGQTFLLSASAPLVDAYVEKRNHLQKVFTLGEGEQIDFVLGYRKNLFDLGQFDGTVNNADVLAKTVHFWKQWLWKLEYSGPYIDVVKRSALTLKLLTFAPSGAVVAAATTSIPEDVGSSRTWDYRYCWLRDATITLLALLEGGFTQEAAAWRSWLLRTVAGDPADLQIMYGVAGERRLDERTLPWLSGYQGAAPVRVGNAAVDQLQLDVYGEVTDALFHARLAGIGDTAHGRTDALTGHGTDDDPAWALQTVLVDFLETGWSHPDSGMWEMRGPTRHFTASKVMAWVAVDRSVRMAEQFGLPAPLDRWRALRDTIHRDALARGFDHTRNTFTQSYDSPYLDAALLNIALVGFLPPDDPRIAGTVDAVSHDLRTDAGLLLRYDPRASDDGLPGREGAFLACTFWLAQCQALLGRTAAARSTFERLLDLRTDLGLLSEEYDTTASRLVGNFPQAFSHVPLIATAATLGRTGQTRDPVPHRQVQPPSSPRRRQQLG